jgi:4-hydroxy-tetrahydrodipicolinate synthase
MSLHKMTVFTGAATALITPFQNGEIDWEAFGNLIDLQTDAGIGALLVAGTTGESATLTLREHHDLIAYAARRIGGRVPLLAGCGSNSTAHALTLAESACDAGADALLAVTPYYNKASDRGLLLHYRAIADRATRPLMLYNVPSRTGFHLSMELYRALASHPNIVAVKEASGDLGLLEALCSECGDDLDVYTGNDHQIVAAMKLGAQGVISVFSNLQPRAVADLCRLCTTGDYRTAGKRQRALLPQMQALFWEVNPIPVKYVAALRGLCDAEYRLPLCPPSPELSKKLQGMFP